MHSKNRINIQPFNEIWYINCAYEPILSAVFYFDRDILPILSGTIYTYESSGLFASPHIFRVESSLEEVLDSMGFQIDMQINPEDIINEVRRKLQNNSPVYFPVDSFCYYSNNPASMKDVRMYYKKMHEPHFFIIHGYNDAEEVFEIIDTGSGKCFSNTIAYSDLQTAFDSFISFIFLPNLNRYYGKMLWNPFALGAVNDDALKNDSRDIKKYAILYIQNLLKNKEKIYTGLENIKLFPELYKSWLENPILLADANKLEMDTGKYSKDFSNGTLRKECELYTASRFFGQQSEQYELLKTVYKHLALIKNNCMASIIRQKCDDNLLSIIISCCDDIYKSEHTYYDKLFSTFNS